MKKVKGILLAAQRSEDCRDWLIDQSPVIYPIGPATPDR